MILSGSQTLSPNTVYCTVNVTSILIHLQIRELVVTALHHWFVIVQVLVIRESTSSNTSKVKCSLLVMLYLILGSQRFMC